MAYWLIVVKQRGAPPRTYKCMHSERPSKELLIDWGAVIISWRGDTFTVQEASKEIYAEWPGGWIRPYP